MDKTKDRFIGALFGLIVGNALGAPYKNLNVEKITDFSKGGIYGLNIGEWTDSASMALCLAESLIEDGFDLDSQIKKYLKWIDDGYLSSKDKAFGIDNQTMDALIYYEKYTKFADITNIDSNKSLARLAPIPMFFKNSFKDAIYYSGQSSYTTHNNIYSIHSCKLLGGIIQQAINGENKKFLMNEIHKKMDLVYDVRLRVVDIKYKSKEQIRSSSASLDSLEIALWAFYNTNNFKDAVLTAINFKGDTDTIGAIIGQLAGSYYGYSNLPKLWILKIAKKDLIMEIIENLYNASISTE
ncbi:ADP-ribosyl-[dinitrogen reductase] hydrolase [Marinitoga hydrogenitolerans DSM 16785]|uniref:ADP-ribosyl-[dinitrogen reductase] hydrolase n=1 Tax=Marinitoga hydrogenitolerans (strain DSM 16785 / JCM 12826 / AT1271) TaxID=1122195 RepID=A0A1M4SYB5_MARH1|nr:ADP-ribosylglycohydrolase family protein [Marinitoga hydrogenitolerans]SHE37185.1 ADP-ribosyl-[dinitrogen reductase] hydrolase [Marinitoga hydrogenitolerans DSM 16785]